MKILVNGEVREVADGTSVSELLDVLGVTQPHVAVELNLEVVPCPRAPRDGDRLKCHASRRRI